MFVESFLGSITPESISAFFKGTGILGGAGILLFLLIKHKVFRIVSIDSGSEWIRAKWGVEQYHRFGKLRGRLVRLKSGRHLLVKGIYDGWEICMREIPLVITSLTQPFKGRMLQFDLVTISYQVIAPDTPEGDQLMLRSFLSIRNLDRDNQKSESLDDKVLAIALSGLGKHLKKAKKDKYGMPVISKTAWKKLVSRPLRKKHGVRIIDLEWTAPTLLPGQQGYEAVRMVALALGFKPETETEVVSDDSNVLEMPVHSA